MKKNALIVIPILSAFLTSPFSWGGFDYGHIGWVLDRSRRSTNSSSVSGQDRGTSPIQENLKNQGDHNCGVAQRYQRNYQNGSSMYPNAILTGAALSWLNSVSRDLWKYFNAPQDKPKASSPDHKSHYTDAKKV